MGLTNSSTGFFVAGERSEKCGDYIVALAGNPNVGKSTVFNALTGLKQHTGNWPGKTVGNAVGKYLYKGKEYSLVDVPGTYSLLANSAEEEIARDFLCFGDCDCRIITVDATCLERNLNLVLQILEFTDRAVVLLNLMDEAKKKGIHIDIDELSLQLGVPVIPAAARSGKGLDKLKDAVRCVCEGKKCYVPCMLYGKETEETVRALSDIVAETATGLLSPRWIALKLLERNETLNARICEYTKTDFSADERIKRLVSQTNGEEFLEEEVGTVVARAEQIAALCLHSPPNADRRDRRADRILTSPLTGIPVMLALFALILWITVVGANYPSELLFRGFAFLGEKFRGLLQAISAPPAVVGCVTDGIYLTLTWVVSVMLPPMAIFFPMFTLLEDVGYLPRIAFNLDGLFRRAGAHGKQSLTMCMGFGCNAAGVVGCRIISGKRERLIAILTNSFVPCNGRFPMLIALISLFLAGNSGGSAAGSLTAAGVLALVVVFSAAATLAVSFILSKTLLRGESSAFTLELPPYRVPRIGQVIVRSVLDRTLHVLGRAAAVAAPWGLAVYALANISAGGETLLSWFCSWLDPAARLIGLDGVILAAFILGLPANELVIPIMLMAYTSGSCLTEISSYAALSEVLSGNGWTAMTAVSAVLFTLMHSPCSTTLLTIKKETGSIGWTAAAAVIPTAAGIGLLAVLNCIFG